MQTSRGKPYWNDSGHRAGGPSTFYGSNAEGAVGTATRLGQALPANGLGQVIAPGVGTRCHAHALLVRRNGMARRASKLKDQLRCGALRCCPYRCRHPAARSWPDAPATCGCERRRPLRCGVVPPPAFATRSHAGAALSAPGLKLCVYWQHYGRAFVVCVRKLMQQPRNACQLGHTG